MDLGLAKKCALVTGASKGLGRAVAAMLAEAGADLVLVARDTTALAQLAAELGEKHSGRYYPLVLDLTADGAPSRLSQFCSEKKFVPDIVVHNAGGSLGVKDVAAPVEEWQRVWRFNLGVGIEINRTFLPGMQARGWGRIVHVTTSAIKAGTGNPAYVSAKSALSGYVASLARAVARDGVVVSAVSPGPMRSEGRYLAALEQRNDAEWEEFCRNHLPIGRLATSEEVAGGIVFLCSVHASYAVGATLGIDGGFV